MSNARTRVADLIENGHIAPQNIKPALCHTHIQPTTSEWLDFINRMLLWLGSLAIALASIFLVAFNWDNLGRFTQFAGLEVAIAISIGLYCRFQQNKLLAQVSLVMAALFMGALMALVGQTYQTGADPWQLFFYWAIFIMPWAVIGKSETLWIILIALLNISLMAYQHTFGNLFGGLADFIFDNQFGRDEPFLWVLFMFNTFCLAAWELIANYTQWQSTRWGVRLLAVASGATLTWLSIYAIFEHSTLIYYLIWSGWAACLLLVYRKLLPDLFMLAGVCLSIIVVVTTFIANILIVNDSIDGLLLLAIIVIGLGTASAMWLKRVHKEMLA